MSKKKIGIIVGASVLAVIAVVVAIFAFSGKEETYRMIKMLTLTGKVSVNRDALGDLEGFEGMALQSKDNVHVSGNSNMVMQMDEDKFCYAEENTDFSVVAEGTTKSAQTKIVMNQGVITYDVQKKVNKNSSYEISTPNSTMAIRGTMFTVELKGESTIINLYDGKLELQIINPATGTPESVTLEAGQSIEIRNNGSGNEIVIHDIEPGSLPDLSDTALEAIKEKLKSEGKDAEELLQGVAQITSEQTETSCTVQFMYENEVFCTQTVESGEVIDVPKLQPTEKGHWDMNFAEPVQKNVVANWITE